MPPTFITFPEVIARYDAILLDAYGVLIHHTGAIPGTAAVIDALNTQHKLYYVLTNDSSRLPEAAARRYVQLGLNISVEKIITSGMMIAPYFATHNLQNAPCVVLGTNDTRAYVTHAGGALIDLAHARDAEVIVIGDDTGFEFLPAMNAIITALYTRADRGTSTQLLLPNPDLTYPQSVDSYGLASGSFGWLLATAMRNRYGTATDALLHVVQLGKPERGMFDLATTRATAALKNSPRDSAANLPPPRLVMIGDQLGTDILGGNRAGIDTILVATGVTKFTDDLQFEGATPTFVMEQLLLSLRGTQ